MPNELTAPAETARRALALLDLTELADHASVDDVTRVCQKATGTHGNTAAVCVWPRHVALAARLLDGTGVSVATVVNFPTGDENIHDVVDMASRALCEGAGEIDLVLPYRAFLTGDRLHAVRMVEAVRETIPSRTGLLKVILETGEIGNPEKIRQASILAIAYGADFIKTSTGKTATSASVEATGVMLDVIVHTDRPVGIKPSGGIRTLSDAEKYMTQAAAILGDDRVTPNLFRFGASGLYDALVATIDGQSGVSSQDMY